LTRDNVSLPESAKSRVFDYLRPEDLAGQALFYGIDLDKLIGLLDQCRVRAVEAGETLIVQGEVGKECFLVLSGTLGVCLDPAVEPISSLGVGESVGELSVLDGKPASATVIATEPSRLLVVPEGIFWSLVNVSHDFAQRLLYLLAGRMRDSNRKLSDSLRYQQEYKRNATLDELTGLHNRRWMHEMVMRQINRSRFDGEPLSLFLIDIDHFKSVNDTYGHLAGDQILRDVALIMMNHLRPTDLLARWGGEEFVVALPGTNLAGALIAAQSLCATVRQATLENSAQGQSPAITVSIGVAELQPDQSFEDLVDSADRAMYRAKRNGRNRVEA